MLSPSGIVETRISDASTSTPSDRVAGPADFADLCSAEGPPTVLSGLHDSCGLISLTVLPLMSTGSLASLGLLPVSERSVPLAGQCTSESCLIPHPGEQESISRV